MVDSGDLAYGGDGVDGVAEYLSNVSFCIYGCNFELVNNLEKALHLSPIKWCVLSPHVLSMLLEALSC